jgi:hypothetical protein
MPVEIALVSVRLQLFECGTMDECLETQTTNVLEERVASVITCHIQEESIIVIRAT